jgi:serine protease AprX
MKALKAIKVIKAVKVPEALNLFNLNRLNGFIVLLLLSASYCLQGQAQTYSYFYRVYFRDKGDNITANYSAADLLSSRAVSRRQKSGIQFPDLRDFPVNRSYLEKISSLGLKLHSTSKWMNTALFKSEYIFDISKLLGLKFVSSVKTVKTPLTRRSICNKLEPETIQTDLQEFDSPITMVKGNILHDAGYNGNGILIAVLDAGFNNADNASSLKDLRSRNGIVATHDFVNIGSSIYNSSTHGTEVLSLLAGKSNNLIEGSAPEADYILLKTEDVNSEFPCEEDYWAAGAEFADSSGADIISSSLGYFTFDNPTLNYKNSDLDGKTSFITKVAEIAASKGILVVNSAGNERNDTWKYILFPSDGDSVLAIGAVDWGKNISSFSSAGPSYDKRIKPDNAAPGVNITAQDSKDSYTIVSGTSFACPILSGMAACLMEAVPEARNSDIINVFHSSGDRYNSPDSLYGYGIPDFVIALKELQNKYIRVPEEGVRIYPNPTTTGNFEIIFSTVPGKLTIEIFSLSGGLIYKKECPDYQGRKIEIDDLQKRNQGIYLVRVFTSSGVYVRKIIKIRI